jgi:hypothetical protein
LEPVGVVTVVDNLHVTPQKRQAEALEETTDAGGSVEC